MTVSRGAPFRAVSMVLTAVLAAWSWSGPALAKDEPSPPSAVPFFLKGIDLQQPAQAAFARWPSKELGERAYWLPWNGLTFQRAIVLNQPILLMLTVPWNRAAQQMMEGPLADPTVRRALNHDYITVLVSPDRRPDVYARYATGDWPAISLLLPDGAPMLSQANDKGVALPITFGTTDVKGVLFNLTEGRTYFDKWQNVLQGVSQVYAKRVDLEDPKPGVVEAKAVEPVVRWLLGNVDGKNGGFGAAPKYALPSVMEWAFVREDQGRLELVDAARKTLKKMAESPLFDKKDGGFHRMAAAPDWGAIQYEKMLAGNVDLIRDLVFALREGDDPALRSALAATCRFVVSVLARPEGGFYLGQDADPTSADGGGYWRATNSTAAKAPPIDQLVLAGPNAMAGAALLRAGAILGEPSWETAGRAALDLVAGRAVSPGRGAAHVIESEPDIGRYLVTQSEVAFGLLDGYEATGDARYLAAAKDVAEFVRNNMKVGNETSFRDHLPIGREFGILDMPLRPMIDNARLSRVLVRLAAQGVLQDGRTVAAQVLGSYAGELAEYGVRGVEPGLAIEEALTDPLIVTLRGTPGDPAAALRRAALNLRRGWVVIRTAPGDAPPASLSWHGLTRTATDPASLVEAEKSLLEASVKTP